MATLTLEELSSRLDRLEIEVKAYGCIAKALVLSPMHAKEARGHAGKIFVADGREFVIKQLDDILASLGHPRRG